MEVDATRHPMMGGWPAWTLVVGEVFVSAQAFYGGLGLITDSWQLPAPWLVRTPFSSWVGPGWLLIGLVAVPHLLAAASVVLVPRRPQLGIVAGMLAGGSLLVWIAVQVTLLQVYFFLQPVIFAVGLVEIGLALWWRHRLARSAVHRSRPTAARTTHASSAAAAGASRSDPAHTESTPVAPGRKK